jgi:hypothetical protein
VGDALEAGGGGAACERTGGPAAGVPQPSQNACPSANGLPQFLQKPAIFASQNFSAQVLLYVLCIVPEAQSTGKHDLLGRCATKLLRGVIAGTGREENFLAVGGASSKKSVQTVEQVEWSRVESPVQENLCLQTIY